jgi:hypothetical protein
MRLSSRRESFEALPTDTSYPVRKHNVHEMAHDSFAYMGGEQLSNHFCYRNARCAADWTQNGFFPVLRIWAEFLGSNRRFFCLPRPAWINWSLFIKRSLFKVRTSRCAYRDVSNLADQSWTKPCISLRRRPFIQRLGRLDPNA